MQNLQAAQPQKLAKIDRSSGTVLDSDKGLCSHSNAEGPILQKDRLALFEIGDAKALNM